MLDPSQALQSVRWTFLSQVVELCHLSILVVLAERGITQFKAVVVRYILDSALHDHTSQLLIILNSNIETPTNYGSSRAIVIDQMANLMLIIIVGL